MTFCKKNIGNGNRDHATSSKRGSLERFTTYLSKPDLNSLLNESLQVPSFEGGCVIPFTVPYLREYLLFWKVLSTCCNMREKGERGCISYGRERDFWFKLPYSIAKVYFQKIWQ